MFTTEPAVIFDELLAESREQAASAELEEDRVFEIKTTDPVVPSFADELINQHYPAQTQLPLD
jgi:hypothetical protein